MITVTKDMYSFMSDDTPLYIYGAGRTGYWCGHYMNEMGIAFDAYVDKIGGATAKGCVLNDHPILDRTILYDRDRDIRVIVASSCYQDILSDLLLHDQKRQNRLLCYVPVYPRLIDPEIPQYNANRMLAYFRKKLLKGRFPSIICNDCTGGMIYELFDENISTPFINTGFRTKDFFKLLGNLESYLKMDLNNVRTTWDVIAKIKCVEATLGDIKIVYGHDMDPQTVIRKWNALKSKIDFDNILIILTDRYGLHSFDELETFRKLPYKSLVLYEKKQGTVIRADGQDAVYWERPYIFDYTDAIENHFNIVDWINNMIKE